MCCYVSHVPANELQCRLISCVLCVKFRSLLIANIIFGHVYRRLRFLADRTKADRTNGRAYATVLRLSVCLSVCLWRYVLWLNGASYSKSYYWQPTGNRVWGIDWYQNEWPWSFFRGRLRLCHPLKHIRHWISRKPLQIEAWFQRTTNRKWPMGNRMVTWQMTPRYPERSSRDPNTLKAQ